MGRSDHRPEWRPRGLKWGFFLAAALAFWIWLGPAPALATAQGSALSFPGTLDTGEIDRFLREIDRDVGGFAPNLSIRGLWENGFSLNWGEISRGMLRYLFGETLANSSLLAKLVALALVAAILENLQTSFEGSTAGKLAGAVCYLVLAALAMGSFYLAFTTGRAVVERLVSFMQALLPTLLALLAANGGLATAPLLHPLMVAVVNLGSVLVADVVLPLILFTAALEIASTFSESFKLGGLISLLRYGSVTALGAAMVLVLGVSTVLKASGPVADGVALRTGKFLANTFIPVVGKMFSDAAELAWGTSSLLMNVVGLAGAVGVLLLVAFPLLKLAAVILTYRLAGALIQPVSSPQVVDLLNGIANSVAMVFVAVAAAGLMFFIGVTIIMGAGNALMMLRTL